MKTNLKEMKFKFINFERITTYLFNLSILVCILAFNLSDNPPPQGWYQQFLPNIGSHTISDVFFLDSLNGWAVTPYAGQNDTAFVLKTTSGGDNWFKSNTRIGQYTGYNKVKFLNSLTGFVCGPLQSNGFKGLCKSTDGGFNWVSLNVPDPYAEYADMSILNADTIWLVAYDSFSGGVYLTTNGGLNWIRQYSAGSDNPDKIYMFNARIGFIAKNVFPQYNNLRKTTDGGFNWFDVNSDGFRDMHFVDSLTGWKSTGGDIDSTMKKTTDGGLTWSKQILLHGGYNISSGIIRFSNINKDTIWGIGSYILYPNSQIRPVLWRTTNGGNNWAIQVPDTSLVHLFAPYNFISFIDKSIGWAYYFDRGIHTVTGGDTTFLSSIHQISSEVPKDFKLFQNYPNPFNQSSIINYQLLIPGMVRMDVYDIAGKQITTLVNQRQNSGEYSVTFDGSNLSSGVYFYKLFVNGNVIDTKKAVLIK